MVPGSKLFTVISMVSDISVHDTVLRVAVASLLNHVSCESAGEVYVARVAPAIVLNAIPLMLLSHWYVFIPSPLAATLVNGDGAVASQIVWSEPIEPGAKLITVTLRILVSSVHSFPLSVDLTSRLVPCVCRKCRSKCIGCKGCSGYIGE